MAKNRKKLIFDTVSETIIDFIPDDLKPIKKKN